VIFEMLWHRNALAFRNKSGRCSAVRVRETEGARGQ